jgi:ferredoxin-NADP reductase
VAVKKHFYTATLRRAWYTNDRTKHFEFEIGDGQPFDYLPGQFISMDVIVDGREVLRSYSLASSPHHDHRFDLCLNIVPDGVVSPWLFHLKPGDQIEFTGPWGSFVLREPMDPVSAFIATGTGIAPIRAMLQYAFREGGPAAASREVWLIFGVRSEADILYREEFEQLAREHANFRFVPTLSRPGPGWRGATGYVQQQIVQHLGQKSGFHAYICGLKKMVDDVRRQLEGMGYPASALSYEKYD